MSNEKVKVLFIEGYGRSGTTLLDRMLGQIDGFFSGGELRHIWSRGFGESQLCNCGSPFKECKFWSSVAQRAFGGFDKVDAERIEALRYSVDRLRYVPRLRPTARNTAFKKRVEEYASLINRLYSAIREVSGCKVIVDSSKSPSHGFILRNYADIDLYSILLLRDSRAVAFSWMRNKLRPEIHWKKEAIPLVNPVESSMLWNACNFLALKLATADRPVPIMRYEDLIMHPAETVRNIIKFAGFDENMELEFLQGHKLYLESDHMVSGNPIRFKTGWVDLKCDEEWKVKMSAALRILVTALTLPGLGRNKYPIGIGRVKNLS